MTTTRDYIESAQTGIEQTLEKMDLLDGMRVDYEKLNKLADGVDTAVDNFRKELERINAAVTEPRDPEDAIIPKGMKP